MPGDVRQAGQNGKAHGSDNDTSTGYAVASTVASGANASSSSRSPSSPATKTSVLARIRNAFSSSGSFTRERTTTLDSSSSPKAHRSKAHAQAAKLANLRAYANGNVSSIDLSHLPPLPASAQSSLSSSSSASAYRSASSNSDALLSSPSPQDGFLHTRNSPLSSSPSQRSPLSLSYSPSGASQMHTSPAAQRSTFDSSPGATGMQAPARTHRKATKSTATLPGWLAAPFGGSNTRAAKPAYDTPSTPTSASLPDSMRSEADNDATPKQKKRRTKNEDAMRALSSDSVSRYLGISCLLIPCTAPDNIAQSLQQEYGRPEHTGKGQLPFEPDKQTSQIG